MQYRNIKTGAVIEVSCPLAGDWEPVKTAPVSGGEKDEAPKKKTTRKER